MSEPLPELSVPMVERLAETAETRVAGGCEEVWERIFATTKRDGADQLLEVRQLWGSRNAPGHQTVQRYADDLLDYEVLETIREYDRPLRVAFDQRILRFLAYDPSERLPQTIAPDIVPDPERAFSRAVGRNPWLSRTEIDLKPVQGETELSLRVSLLTEKPLGWLWRRRWQARAKADLVYIMQKVAD